MEETPPERNERSEIASGNDSLSRSWASRPIYISHFLSAWNSRGFEFGAILFLANIYPGTLMPMSIYALVRAASAIVAAPWIGQYIDSQDRLSVVRVSIVGQRLAVAISCCVFWSLIQWKQTISRTTSLLAFICLIILACVEKLCSIMNTISIERDWVVVIADANQSPLAIALVDGISSQIATLITLSMSCLCVGIEYTLIAWVRRRIPALSTTGNITAERLDHLELEHHSSSSNTSQVSLDVVRKQLIFIWHSLKMYTQSSAFLPSLALSCLYLTVLSFSGHMTTFLLAVPEQKFTSGGIGMLRTISTILEISGTFLAPKIMSKIGPVRAGIWFLSSQALSLSTAVGLLWSAESPIVAVPGFIAGVIFSRIGLWSFDLCAQLIIQETIGADHRGLFSSTEASLQNCFELISFATTIIFPRPDQFRYPALISLIAVYFASGLYAKYVRDQRGHLLHLPPCVGSNRYKLLTSEMRMEDL